MDRREVDGVQHEVGFAVEALVGALRVVDDVDGQVAVVPRAAVLAADLLAGGVGIGSGPAADRLVVGEQRGEPGERAEPVDRQRVGQVPGADVQLVEQLVELAHEIRRAVSPRHRRLPLRAGTAPSRFRVRQRAAEDPLVLIEEGLRR